MAQNFRRYTENNIGTSAVDFPDGSNFDSYDTIVGIHLANIVGATVNVEVYINDGSNDRYIIKNAPLPTGSSLECVQGKIVIPSGGAIKVKKDGGTADVIVSLLTDVA